MPSEALLDVSDIVVAYGGVRALDRCSISAAKRSITGLVGPNGAGKSTLIEAISGGVTVASGRIMFDGDDITGWSRLAVAKAGIIRSFQISREFARLPVIENLTLAAGNQRGESLVAAIAARRTWREQEETLRKRARELLDWTGLRAQELAPAASLSGGQRRLLDLTRALMADPRLLLLDEPTAGVHPIAAKLIASRLRDLPSMGVSVLLIAHDMEFIEDVCSEVVAIAQGRVVTKGTMADVRNSPELAAAYLGA